MPCLILLGACTTADPLVVVKPSVTQAKVPAALLRPCPKRWRKAGGPATVQDFVQRGDTNEAALGVCSAQVDAIRKWDAAPTPVSP